MITKRRVRVILLETVLNHFNEFGPFNCLGRISGKYIREDLFELVA